MLLGLAGNANAQAPTGIALSLNPATVTESADPTTISVTATLIGGTFPEERRVLLQELHGTATTNIDYTTVGARSDLVIPANTASGSLNIMFTANVDEVNEPGGETVRIRAVVLQSGKVIRDTSVASGDATITINDPVDSVDPTILTFAAGAGIANQTYTWNVMITPVTLPEATGGTAPITYSLSGTLIAGLTFDPMTRVLSGTPTVRSSKLHTYTATDSASPAATASLANFAIRVELNTIPNLTSTPISAQNYLTGVAVNVTLPAATSGNGALTYTLTPTVPGLTLNPTTRVLSGTPTTAAATATHTYTATDEDGSEGDRTFSITVTEDSAPVFSVASIADQTFTVGTEVDLTLPTATGGNAPLTYTISRTLPAGLTFNADATPPTITGTPTLAGLTVTGRTYFYGVVDSDSNTAASDTDSRRFRINIQGVTATGITMTVRDLAGEPLTSLNEDADPTTFRLYFDTVPALSGFTADQDVTITLSTPVAGQVGYTGAASVADFIDRDVASTESRLLQLTVTDDDVATADGVVTYTATVSPSGFTATAMITLVDNEISIVTTPAAVTLATGATADYTVQLDQEPPGSVTVSVTSVGDAIATVSRNTRVFTAANWNVSGAGHRNRHEGGEHDHQP